MKIRTLLICFLAVLVVLNVSPAQVVEAPGQEPQKPAFQRTDSPDMSQSESTFIAQAAEAPTPDVPRQARSIPTPPVAAQPKVRTTTAKSPTELKIFELKYADAKELSRLIENIFRIQVDIDYRLNRVIVNATQEQMESIENLIEATDVAGPEASTSRDVQNLVYRIYMFETSSGNEGMKPFSLILQTSTHVASQELLDATAEKDLQIGEFLQSNEGLPEPQAEILIQGKAVSNESLRRVVDKFPESHIMELKWDDGETFTNYIAAAQYTQLPDQMQRHIRKFMGDDIRTVGYWFGNISVPGEVEAPIGPWVLTLRLDTESDRMLELRVDVEIPNETNSFYRRLRRERSDEILSNTIRAKIGKPIIIGYNRESYGSRKMGAMVIVPEMDTIQVKEK